MTDRLDRRIQSFVVELLADSPPAPPFPHPDTVVIDGGRRAWREPMTTTETRRSPSRARSRGPIAGVLAFGGILLLAIVTTVLVNVLDSEPKLVAGPEDLGDLAGTSWEIQTVSQDSGGLILFEAGNRFSVIRPDGRVDDSGEYRIDGEAVTFITDPGLVCAGTQGRYTWSFPEAGRARWDIVFDECTPRAGVANGSEVVQVRD